MLRTSARRVNAPHFGGDDVRFSETAIFWFGQVTADDNYADVRVGYNDSDLYVNLTIFDRLLWYDPSANFDDLSNYDAASLYINLEGNVGSEPGVNAYKFVGQLNWWEARDGFEASFQGDGVNWAVELVGGARRFRSFIPGRRSQLGNRFDPLFHDKRMAWQCPQRWK